MSLYEGGTLPTSNINELSIFQILAYLYHERQCFAAVVIDKDYVENTCNNEQEITNEEFYRQCENLNEVFIEEFEENLFNELFSIFHTEDDEE